VYQPNGRRINLAFSIDDFGPSPDGSPEKGIPISSLADPISFRILANPEDSFVIADADSQAEDAQNATTDDLESLGKTSKPPSPKTDAWGLGNPD
jgi:hypothetical protein